MGVAYNGAWACPRGALSNAYRGLIARQGRRSADRRCASAVASGTRDLGRDARDLACGREFTVLHMLVVTLCRPHRAADDLVCCSRYCGLR